MPVSGSKRIMKLIHTADVHLDACFSSLAMPARYGNRRRQSLRDVFQHIVQRAAAWPADALLIAGDLFDHDRVTRDTIAFVIREFESISPVPVFIAPGNHDPYTEDSPYANHNWPANVHIFDKPEWTSVSVRGDRLRVHGFAFDGPDISSNPFGQLTIPEDSANTVHVAVAHGSERSRQPADKTDYAPFDAAAAAPPGLAYLALGHFHSTTPVTGEFDTVVYYSGSPEGHGFNEAGMHYHLEIEIDEKKTGPNAERVNVTKVPSSRVKYVVETVDCSPFMTTHQIVESLRAYAKSEALPLVARIVLAGSTSLPVQAELAAIRDAVENDFEFLQLHCRTKALEDYDMLAREETSLGGFIRAVNNELRDATDPARRQLLERARDVGLAAYRNECLAIRGIEDPAEAPAKMEHAG